MYERVQGCLSLFTVWVWYYLAEVLLLAVVPNVRLPRVYC
jgi:hypothetical protein